MSERCDHEDTEIRVGPCGPEEFCLECGAELDADGPMDDGWINRAYEAQADAAEHRRRTDPWNGVLEDLGVRRMT